MMTELYWVRTSIVLIFIASLFAVQEVRAANLKTPLCGLVTMGAIGKLLTGRPVDSLAEAKAHPGLYSGVVFLASWAQLEPAPGQFDFSILDHDLAELRAYNAAHSERPAGAKLRITAGATAPQWVMQLSGSPIFAMHQGNQVAIGRFWTAPYRDSWRQFQQALAARYDNEPLIREVAVSSCATMTAEPFVIPLTPLTLPELHAAGFSDAQFKSCLMGALDDYSVWHETAIDFTFNPFRDTDTGPPRPDPQFTASVMEAFRSRFGARAVIANHGLESPMLGRQEDLYSEIERLGPPVEFQTMGPTVDFAAAWQASLRYHPTELEMWDTRDAGGPGVIDVTTLKAWSSALPCGG